MMMNIMMKNKRAIFFATVLCISSAFAQNTIYEQEIIKTYTLPLKEALNDEMLLSNIKSGRLKAAQIDTSGVIHKNNINSNDMIVSDNMIIIGKNIGNNHIKTHNDLLQLIKANLANVSSIDKNQMNYLLNLLEIKEETKK